MKYAINTKAILLFIGGKNIRIEKTDKDYAKIIQVFKLPADEQEDAVHKILDPKINAAAIINQAEGFDFIVEDGVESVWYDGEQLPKAFQDKILSIVAEDLPLDHFVKFWENLSQNPSAQSVKELTDFLDYKELAITEDGCFLAYKGVRTDYYSSTGNTETKVLQGKVDDTGHIYNGIGEVIEVRRRDVNDDRNIHCSSGLHCGSLDYARGFAPKLIIVKVNPKDVVSVPNDCNCQKCRVTKYEVVSDFVEEIVFSVVDENLAPLTKVDDGAADTSRKEVISKVAKYMQNKRNAGVDEITVRQIQNSFTPNWVSKEEVLDALQSLEASWTQVDGTLVVLL
jgi:hypothetical protein